MTARIQFPLQYLRELRLWPTDQANPYPYVREKIEKSDWKFNRLEKLLPLGQLATWPVSHLSQLSHNVSTEKYFGPNLSVYSVSIRKYFGPKCMARRHLQKLAKYFLSSNRLSAIVGKFRKRSTPPNANNYEKQENTPPQHSQRTV